MLLRPYQDDISSKAADCLEAFGLCYLAMECRTGKTMTALAAAAKFGATSVLFVSKKKALASIMADYEAFRPSFKMACTNYESAHKTNGFFDLVILDEAHCLGAFPKPSKRQALLREICKDLPIIFLSGTPSPESYSQLFHQLQVSSFSPWNNFANFYKWAKGGFVHVCQRMINGRILNDYSKADEGMIRDYVEPFLLTYTQEQAGFESRILEHDLFVEMEPETVRTFADLQSDKVIQLPNVGLYVVGDTPAALLNKLHQISGGTVIAENGEALIIDRSKAEAIRRNFAGKKIAVFYTYQAEGVLLKQTFGRWTDNPEEFQASEDLTFIAQVRSAREGVRLDTADAIVFYSLEYSYLSYEQARQRSTSKERSKASEVFYCISNLGLDGDILDAVRSKQDFTLSYYGKQLIKRATKRRKTG